MEILVVVGAVLMMLAVEFSTAKPTAKRWSPPSMTDAAKLMGINTGLVITFPIAVVGTAGFAGGALIAPLTLTGAMGVVLGLKAFGRHHRRADQRHGHHRRRHHLGVAETTTGFYISDGLQGRARPGAAAVLVLAARWSVRQTAIKKV
jgi:branched-chain amino acid transport system permease protein